MPRLMMYLFPMVATALMGSAIVAVLTVEKSTTMPIAIASLVGFVVAIPVSWLVARSIAGSIDNG